MLNVQVNISAKLPIVKGDLPAFPSVEISTYNGEKADNSWEWEAEAEEFAELLLTCVPAKFTDALLKKLKEHDI